MGDASRLPKWAQQRLDTLESNLATAERDLERMTEAAGYREGRYGELVAPADTPVVFGGESMTDHKALRVRLTAEGQLIVGGGNVGIVVVPQASNVVRIEVRR